MSSVQYLPLKQPSERKLLLQFTETLDIKQKTEFCRLRDAKSKRKAIRAGSMLWFSIKNYTAIPKSMNVFKKIFTSGFYTILGL